MGTGGGRHWGLRPNVSILVLRFQHFQMACLNRIFSYFFTQSDNCRFTVFYFDEGCLRDTVHYLHAPLLEVKPCNLPVNSSYRFYKAWFSEGQKKNQDCKVSGSRWGNDNAKMAVPKKQTLFADNKELTGIQESKAEW